MSNNDSLSMANVLVIYSKYTNLKDLHKRLLQFKQYINLTNLKQLQITLNEEDFNKFINDLEKVI